MVPDGHGSIVCFIDVNTYTAALIFPCRFRVSVQAQGSSKAINSEFSEPCLCEGQNTAIFVILLKTNVGSSSLFLSDCTFPIMMAKESYKGVQQPGFTPVCIFIMQTTSPMRLLGSEREVRVNMQ